MQSGIEPLKFRPITCVSRELDRISRPRGACASSSRGLKPNEALVSDFAPRLNGQAVRRRFRPLKPLFNGEHLQMASPYPSMPSCSTPARLTAVRPFVSPQIARLSHRVARAGSRRWPVRRDNPSRGAIAEPAPGQTRWPAATLKQGAPRGTGRRSVIKRREDGPWA
jgi:hypothetical protein